MMEEYLPAGSQYAVFILTRWVELYDLGETYRMQYLKGEIQDNVTYAYIAKLTRLWGDLKVKVEGRNDLKMSDGKTTLAEAFEKFSTYYFDPDQIMPKSLEDAKIKGDEIYKLEQLLRVTIEKLKVTEWVQQ